MGIEGLGSFLKDKYPHIPESVRLRTLAGTRVAIDGHNWMFIHMSIAQKSVVNSTNLLHGEPDRNRIVSKWVSNCLNSLAMWLEHGIVPIVVFDGKHPEDKGATKEKRQKEFQKKQTELSELKDEMGHGDLLSINYEKLDRLKKLYSNGVSLGHDDTQLFQNVLEQMGMPYIRANCEAEKLCSMLCREGRVEAVYSEDSDNIAYGCPFLIKDLGNPKVDVEGRPDRECTVIRYSRVQAALGLTYEQFLDFCILCGCDYNQRVKGLGPVNAYKKIKQFGSLEEIAKTVDLTPVRYERCRELFAYEPSRSLMDEGTFEVSMGRLQSEGRAILTALELEYMIGRFYNLYKALPPMKETFEGLRSHIQVELVLE